MSKARSAGTGRGVRSCASFSQPDVAGYQNCIDATEHHFTGKERDAESGNDYFGARYYASAMGRFLSPDPKIMTARHLANPQKWNKYAYVINNPLMRFDPDGTPARLSPEFNQVQMA